MNQKYIVIKNSKEIKVGFLEYQVKLLTIPPGQLSRKEILFNEVFNEEWIIQARLIGKNEYQVVGARREVIERLYQDLNIMKSQVTVVPYGLTIIALLKARGVDLAHLTVFIDYSQSDTILTIIDGEMFNVPRSINVRERDKVMFEVDRSVKHYYQLNEANQAQGQVRIISNEEMGIVNPSEEGLRAASFNMHFDLPSRVFERKQRSYFFRMAINIGMTLSVGAGILAGYVYLAIERERQDDLIKEAKILLTKQHQSLNELRVNKMMDILSQDRFPDLERFYTQSLNLFFPSAILYSLEMKNTDKGYYYEILYEIKSILRDKDIRSITAKNGRYKLKDSTPLIELNGHLEKEDAL